MHKLSCWKKIRSRADWSQVRKRHSFPTWIKKENKEATGFESLRPKYCIRCNLRCFRNQLFCKLDNMRAVLTKMNLSTGIHNALSLILCRTAVFKNVCFRRPSMAASVSGKSMLQNSCYTSALKTIEKCMWRSSTYSILV